MKEFFLPSPEKSENDDFQIIPKLSFKEKLITFILLNLLGYLLQLGSYFRFLTSLIKSSPEKFALTYSFGNILSLLGTCILIGFKKQIKNITHKKRREISGLFFGSLLICVFCPLFLPVGIDRVVVTFAVLVQMGCYWWYTLSYLPWARGALKSFFGCCFSVLKG